MFQASKRWALGSLVLAFSLCMVVSADERTAISAENENVIVRGDFANLRHVIKHRKRAHVAFLGGSITQNGGGHTGMIPAMLVRDYPDCDFNFNNAGLSSTCSVSGAFRLESHVLNGPPVDLLIVEFAVNDDQDAGHSVQEATRGMEGIIRKLRATNPAAEIIMVHYVNPGMLATLQAGKTPIPIKAHRKVAAHYGISEAFVAQEIADAVTAKRYQWADYGGTHPKKFGYEVASNMIYQIIEQGLANDGVPQKLADFEIPSPIDDHSYGSGSFVAVTEAKTTGNWQIAKANRQLLPIGGIRGDYEKYDALRSDEPGASFSLEFEGNAVGAFILAGPDAGKVEATVDGKKTTIDLYHRYSRGLNYPRSAVFGSGLKSGKHVLELTVSKEKNELSKGRAVTILFFEVNK